MVPNLRPAAFPVSIHRADPHGIGLKRLDSAVEGISQEGVSGIGGDSGLIVPFAGNRYFVSGNILLGSPADGQSPVSLAIGFCVGNRNDLRNIQLRFGNTIFKVLEKFNLGDFGQSTAGLCSGSADRHLFDHNTVSEIDDNGTIFLPSDLLRSSLPNTCVQRIHCVKAHRTGNRRTSRLPRRNTARNRIGIYCAVLSGNLNNTLCNSVSSLCGRTDHNTGNAGITVFRRNQIHYNRIFLCNHRRIFTIDRKTFLCGGLLHDGILPQLNFRRCIGNNRRRNNHVLISDYHGQILQVDLAIACQIDR